VPIKDYSAGQRLSASDLNTLTDTISAQGKLSIKSPLGMSDTDAGVTYSYVPFGFYGRITAVSTVGGSGSGAGLAGPRHDWVEVELMPDGSHRDKDAGRTGTDLFSVNGYSAPINSVVEIIALGDTYWFSSFPGSETAFVLVTSNSPISGGYYSGVRLIQTGLPDTWGLAESVAVQHANGNALHAGVRFIARKNQQTYNGLNVWEVNSCCETGLPPPSGSGSYCCDLRPIGDLCLTISAPDCPCFDGYQTTLVGSNPGGWISDWSFACCCPYQWHFACYVVPGGEAPGWGYNYIGILGFGYGPGCPPQICPQPTGFNVFPYIVSFQCNPFMMVFNGRWDQLPSGGGIPDHPCRNKLFTATITEGGCPGGMHFLSLGRTATITVTRGSTMFDGQSILFGAGLAGSLQVGSQTVSVELNDDMAVKSLDITGLALTAGNSSKTDDGLVVTHEFSSPEVDLILTVTEG
jgi:hypothetical protein